MRNITWQMRLRKLAFVLALPILLPVMILAALVTTWPNMECIGMSNHKCELFTDADCSKCSLYEPKEAYRGVGR